ncbi:MAG: NADH:ubiquinone reductase (Na(+)-transporting) subunit C [Deltaproteobacteria bacterium]|nr:NADH:ubiquinone reductase (Na(+)-transporting) subunit C [Deltaproteobacteria bacterium]MBW2696850.1 NADH:ubiquinone reductase (Na(+)-transporting) subunit C [Deltaproteobacteria bacterium]
MAEASTPKTYAVALILAVSCAALIAVTAVTLADRVQANKDRERMAQILAAAGVANEGAVEMRIVELATGRYVASGDIGTGTFEQAEAASDPALSDSIPDAEDIAELERRERYAWVGLIHEDDRVARLILPVRGSGYGGMIEGFVILDGDLTTMLGVRFTAHDETPGLGSEITSEIWRKRWEGKRIYDESGEVWFEVVQGAVSPSSPLRNHQVDGISGATITSHAVTQLVRFWFGPWGFQPYLERLASEESAHE